MDFWRSLQEVLPRFFQGSPSQVPAAPRQLPARSRQVPGSSQPGPVSSQAAPSQVPAAPGQLPGSSQPGPGSSQAAPRQVPAAPGRSSRQLSDSFSQRPALPNESPRAVFQAFLGSQKIVQASRGSSTTLGELLAAPRQFPAALRRITYQEWPSRITYQARPSSCLRPLGLFQFGASVELSRHVLSFKTIYSNVPPRCSS